jgi:hypothetical protein
MNTQKYNIIIDHQFHSCFEMVQGYGSEMSSEINVIVHCAREYITRAVVSFFLLSFFSGPKGEAALLYRFRSTKRKSKKVKRVKRSSIGGVREVVNRLVTIICII